jgi:nucleoside-diphosphate-sugar epimerase
LKEEKREKALVTGGGGFLGKAIVKQLLNKNYDVYSFSRSRYDSLGAMGITQIQGDISDPIAVDQACRGMDVVFHAAARAGVWGEYEDYFQTNVLGTRNIVSSCLKNNVRRLIYTSSASVVYNGKDMKGANESAPYPEKYLTHYPKTKAMAEQIVVNASGADLLTLVLRPHLIWGPEDNHLVPRIIERADRLFKVGNGKNIADTIYIDNAAAAHVLAAEKLNERPDLSGNIYFISQGDLVPVWDMINNILKAAGLNPVERSIPARLAWIAGVVLELIYKAFKIRKEPQMTRFVALELSTSHWYDISAAKKDLGYETAISTEEGLIRFEKWLKNNRHERIEN